MVCRFLGLGCPLFFIPLHTMSKDSKSRLSIVAVPLFFLLGVLFSMVFLQNRMRSPQINFVYEHPQGKLDAVLYLLEENYVDTVDTEKLVKAGLVSMMRELDPHSAYIDPKEFVAAEEEIKGNFHGIGVQFRMIQDTVTVIMPVSGGPSEKVGIKAGDKIVVAGKDTISGKKLGTDKVVSTLKGPKGSKVRLGILRSGEKSLRYVSVKRDVIPDYSVEVSFMAQPDLGYVKVSRFSATTAREFEDALHKLSKEGMKRLIVDLRSNGGGLLTTCLEICDMFLKKGDVIVYTEGRAREVTEIKATGKGLYQDIPLVVLMDEWSASASEIFAGAMQDNDRGVIVGRRSFGKGLVQEQISLNDGSAVRITVARYHTASGRCIQKPYDGTYEDYEADVLQRYLTGEMTGQDSVLHADTTRYYTRKGRVVYGGGGIHPDVLVPYRTDSLFAYTNQINNRMYSYDFCFDYTVKNRETILKRYPDARSFTQGFEISDELFEEFLKYTEKRGLPRNMASLSKYGEDLRLTLKSLIGRDLYDNEGFYPTYLLRDDDFQKALDLFSGKLSVAGLDKIEEWISGESPAETAGKEKND